MSGEGLELPYVTDPRDVALLDCLHGRVSALSAPEGWSATFGRELNATDDHRLFAAGEDGIPVVDGRHIVPFALIADMTDRVVATRHVPDLARRLPAILGPRLAYRDVASPTNRVTLIAAVLPPRVVSTHTLFCLRAAPDLDAQYCLCALLNSLVANYLVRMRVTTHLTVALVSRLPVPRPARGTLAFDTLAACARELQLVARAAPGAGRARNAALCERAPAWARAQALAAHEYGLDEDEMSHVLSTFPLVDQDARRAVFDAFCALR